MRKFYALLFLVSCQTAAPGPAFERFELDTTPTARDYPGANEVVLLDRGTLIFSVEKETRAPIAKLERYFRKKVLVSAEFQALDVAYDANAVLAGLSVRVTLPDRTRLDVPPENFVDSIDAAQNRVKSARIKGVTAGSVIEYAYDLFYRDVRFLPPWVFQARAPVVRSEFAMIVPPDFEVDFRWTEQGAPKEAPPERFSVPEGTRLFWSQNKLPALFAEPDMPNLSLVSPTLHVVFKSAKIQDLRFEGFHGWDDVRAWFEKKKPAWELVSKEQAAEAHKVAGETSEEERALKLLAILARDLGVDFPGRMLWQSDPMLAETILLRKRGDATDRGIALVGLLRAIGLNAHPAFVAYRDRGILFPDLPNVRSVDGLAAVVLKPDSILVLDPSSLTVSADVPSPRLQDTRIVVLRKDGATEVMRVPISDPSHSKTELVCELRIEAGAGIVGTLQARLTGAEAGELRRALLSGDPEKYPEITSEFLNRRGLPFWADSLKISDLSALRRPLSIQADLKPKKKALDSKAEPLDVPLTRFFEPVPDSVLESRRSPVSLAAPHQVEIRTTLFLPENSEISALPEAMKFEWKGGSFELSARKESSRRIGLLVKSESRALSVSREEYPKYRDHLREIARALENTITVALPKEKTYEY